MSNTVFILGAGASRESGAPLMANFLDVADHLWKLGVVRDADADFKRVFEGIAALQPVHSKSDLDICNIESVFAAFEMARTLSRFPGRADEDIPTLIASLKKVIVHTLEHTVQLTYREHHVFPTPSYEYLVNLVRDLQETGRPKHSVAVLSFNYDMGLDYALHHGALAYDYGLTAEIPQGVLPFLKLHGSLNWAHCGQCNSVVPITLKQFFQKFHFDVHGEKSTKVNLTIGSNLAKFEHCKTALEPDPSIVPPTWHKEDYHRAIATVWAHAAHELSEAENVFVLGYSLPISDAFFRYLYALGTVGDVPFKRFWVFNPDDSGDIERRFQQVLGPGARARFSYFPQRFSDATAQIREEFTYGRE